LVEHATKLLAAMGQLPPAGGVELRDTLVGMDAKVEDLEQRLAAAGKSNRMVLLHGMAGIGKTTLARAVFDLLHEQSPTRPCCFVELDARMTDAQLVEKQSQLLKCLVGEAPTRLGSVEQGRLRLGEKLRGKRVVMVVDGVWGGLLQRLLPEDITQVVREKSMVLVTSRDSRAAHSFIGVDLVQADLLPDQDALQVLCQHAYGSNVPPAAETEQIDQVVAWCGGLPMALRVVGRHLRQRRDSRGRFFNDLAAARKSAYKEGRAGRRGSETTLLAALRLSWDALDAEEQEALLDIAWFLKGQPWEQVEAHCGQGVLHRLSRLGLVTREAHWDSSQPIASVHGVIVDFGCSACGGVVGPPQHMALHPSSREPTADELEQV
jgi:DNA polymerase III delta prime subunit